MAQFRQLSASDIQEILLAFGFSQSDYRGHSPIAAGTVNTNVKVDTAGGKRFVRVNEGKEEDDVAREAAIVSHVARGGLQTPLPAETHEGKAYLRWRDQFVSLFPWVEGRVLARADLAPGHVEQVGRALARMHRLGEAFTDQRPGRYEPPEIDRRLARIQALVEADRNPDPALVMAVNRIAPELVALADERSGPVPLGLIHGDLFVDNVLFSPEPQGTQLVALLDFEQASWGRLIYDLAVTTLAFTFGRDDFRDDLVRALFAGYQGERTVTKEERAVFGAELRFVACRFAVTRITDVYLRRADGAPGGKDFRRYLDRLARVTHRLQADPNGFGL